MGVDKKIVEFQLIYYSQSDILIPKLIFSQIGAKTKGGFLGFFLKKKHTRDVVVQNWNRDITT